MTQKIADMSAAEAGRLSSPLSQYLMHVSIDPYPWQLRVVQDVFTPGSRTVVRTPNEAGKTSELVAPLGLAWMSMYPGSQVVSTAGVFRQVSQQLWPVLRAKLSRHMDWTCLSDRIQAPKMPGMPFGSVWNAFSADDPQKAEGYHSRYWDNTETGERVFAPLIYIVDEAKNVDPGIFEAAYRCDPHALLVVSTPGADSGPFFDFFNNKRVGGTTRWKTHAITWRDCPHLMEGRKRTERQNLIDERGEEDPFVQSMVFGNFFRQGDMFVFPDSSEVSHAMSGQVRESRGDRRGACDFSGGGDEQVFAVRDGNVCKEIVAWKEPNAIRLADHFISEFRKHALQPHEIIADSGGLGQTVIDILEERGFRGIYRYRNNGVPLSKAEYCNKVAEDTWTGIRRGIVEGRVSLPHDEQLRDQMRTRMFVLDDGNRIKLEPKKAIRARGQDSPDRLDAITMLFSDVNWDRISASAKPQETDWSSQQFETADPYSFGMWCER